MGPDELKMRGRRLAGLLAAPVVLRLALGSRGHAAEIRSFRDGFADRAVYLPALLRGLMATPRGRAMLRHAASYHWFGQRDCRLGRAYYGPSELAGNLFTAWTGPPIAFLHIEKSAGTALLRWLLAHFHPTQIDHAPHRDLAPHLLSRPVSLVDRARYPIIWGHYDLPSLRQFDSQRFTFTVLREPRSRLASFYDFWRSVDPASFDPQTSFALGFAHRSSLVEFLDCTDPLISDLLDNVYVRRLTGLYASGSGGDPLRDDPQAALAKAIAALDGLDFVGISEQLDASAARLARRLGIAAPPEKLSGNVTTENHRDPGSRFREIKRTR
ncbi:MAG: hypothetical protein B7Z80_15220, partial [Rhodospirillales bacterium 20-64-7]